MALAQLKQKQNIFSYALYAFDFLSAESYDVDTNVETRVFPKTDEEREIIAKSVIFSTA